MTARDTIADALRPRLPVRDDYSGADALAEVVIAAVRAMPVEDLAELIEASFAGSQPSPTGTGRLTALVVRR